MKTTLGIKLYLIAPCLAIIGASFHFLILRHPPNHVWKGGGFGMYTEPPASARRVFVGAPNPDGTIVYKRFEPIGKTRRLLKPKLRGFTAFPNAKNEARALDRMLQMGLITESQRKEIFLVLSEIRLDIHQGTFKKSIIYDGGEKLK